MKLIPFFYFLFTFHHSLSQVSSFVVKPYSQRASLPADVARRKVSKILQSSAPDQEQDVVPIESMRVKEIQAELKQRKVFYTDCFDKESLVKRLQEARETTSLDNVASSEDEPEVLDKEESSASDSDGGNPSFDRDAKLSELRGMTVRSLREECAKYKIRWASFVEKEELVQALIEVLEKQVGYSVSGCIQPGEVADLTGDQLDLELSAVSKAPLLLDIYATWCGPCQMMAPELKEAASVLGTKMRVAKIDSDKYPQIAQRLRAGGLPTVLILNGGEELERIEGAMMKDQILQFVSPHAPTSP